MPDHSAFGLVDLLPFIAVGFAAQLVDGALGMAFGVISTTPCWSASACRRRARRRASMRWRCSPPACRGSATSSTATSNWQLFRRLAHPGRDRRRARRLCADPDPCRDGAALRARLSRRDRPLSALARLAIPARAQAAEGRRAIRPCRRLPRRGGRRRLGAGRHLATCSSRAPIRARSIGTVNTAEFFLTRRPSRRPSSRASAGTRSPPRRSAC